MVASVARLGTTRRIQALCRAELASPPGDERCPASHEQTDSDRHGNAAVAHDCRDERTDAGKGQRGGGEKIHSPFLSAVAEQGKPTVPPQLPQNRWSAGLIQFPSGERRDARLGQACIRSAIGSAIKTSSLRDTSTYNEGESQVFMDNVAA
jgi:hypothetical protein